MGVQAKKQTTPPSWQSLTHYFSINSSPLLARFVPFQVKFLVKQDLAATSASVNLGDLIANCSQSLESYRIHRNPARVDLRVSRKKAHPLFRGGMKCACLFNTIFCREKYFLQSLKNKTISATLKETRRRRETQTCRQYELKVD